MAEPEAATAAASAVPEPKKKSRMAMWLILGAGVVLIGGGGFLVRNYLKGSQPASTEGKTDKGENSSLTRIKSMMPLEAFLVNLADTDSTRFVKVTFRLGLDEEKLGEELANDQVILSTTRDRIISILSTKTAEELLTLEGKDRLRNEIREKVNAILPKGKVVEVFIMDFVVQL